MRNIIIAVFLGMAFLSKLEASTLAIGGSGGVDLPLAHGTYYDPGLGAEGFVRVDPYELRFHFGNTKTNTYSVLLGIKHFFSEGVARPYFEGALGPLVVDVPGESLAYGVKAEPTLGIDIGLNQNFSIGLLTRYFGMAYFGDTKNGKFEANHGFSILTNAAIWF